MTQKINDYHNALEKERTLLLQEIKNEERPERFGDDVDEFEEKTDEAEEFSNQLARAQDLKKRLDEIDVALSKIKNGGYGVCQNCGREIGDEVLTVDPAAPRCKDCQQQ